MMIRNNSLLMIRLLTILLIPAAAHSQSAPAIPHGPDAPVFRDYVLKREAHLANLLADNYQKHGHRDPAWEADAEMVLRDFAVLMHRRQLDAAQPLRNRVEKCRKQGCQDPLLDFAWAASGKLLHPRKPGPKYRDLMLSAEKQGYPPEILVYLGSRFAGSVRKSTNFKPPEDFGEHLAAFISSPAARKLPRFSHDQVETIAGKLPLLDLTKLITSAEASPQPGNDAYHLMLAACHDRLSWAVRGGGTVDTVSADAWKVFGRGQQMAYRHYHAAWTIDPSQPTAPAELIAISVAQSGNDKKVAGQWFNLAVAAEMDHSSAYRTMIHYSLPRWGGSLDDLLALAQRCVETRRYDTGVPNQFRAILKQLINRFDGDRRYLENPVCYQLVTQVVNDLAGGEHKVNSSLYDLKVWQSLQALLAFTCGNPAEARKIAGELGDELNRGLFKQHGVDFAQFEEATSDESVARAGQTAALLELAAQKRGAALKIERKTSIGLASVFFGAFVSEDGLALVSLEGLAGGGNLQLSTAGGGELAIGKLLGIFPEHGLALVKFDHRPDVWLRFAPKEPEVAEPIGLLALNRDDLLDETIPPIIGPVMAKRTYVMDDLREARFQRVLSLGSGMSFQQQARIAPGMFAVDRNGNLVAFLGGTRGPFDGQTLIELVPVIDLADSVSQLAQAGKAIPFPIPEAKNPLDPAILDADYQRFTMASKEGDTSSQLRFLADLLKRYPNSFKIKETAVLATRANLGEPLVTLADCPPPDPAAPVAQQIAHLLTRTAFPSRTAEEVERRIREMEQAVELSPKDSPIIRYNLADQYLTQGRVKDAERLLREAFPYYADSIGCVELLESAMTQQANFDEALRLAKRANELRKIYRNP